ncbi:hypothetical protein [Streptomyces sp. NPDC057199]|uniref:hypothetical protein n=1 Tax=Streptomyces sp. NPDC057199 TaxID=3346047 RepID=UPI003631C31A
MRFAITTHDAGHKLTAADFDLAQRIDTIASGTWQSPSFPDSVHDKSPCSVAWTASLRTRC